MVQSFALQHLRRLTFESRRQELMTTAKLLPWGRLVLMSGTKHVPEHFDLARSKHCVGRVAHRCDVHIQRQYISGVHCTIRMLGKDSRGEPLLELEDHSRYGTWVNSQKVGFRRKMELKKGYVIDFTDPTSKDVSRIAYKLEILPSGLTKQNEELHARLSADEMSVADRTRKRTHEETQCTQSPTKVVVSPPRPRPVKKVRRVSKSQEANESEASEDEANPPVVSQSVSEPASEPVSEPSSSPATQPAPESGPRARAATSKAAGKKRRRPDVPAPDSKLAELQKQNDEFAKAIAVNSVALIKKTEEATKNEQDLAASRKENATLKKAHEEEMTKLKNEGAAELAKAKAEAAIELAKQTKSAKQKFDELRQERDNLRKIINDVLADPKAPSQVKTVVELDMTIIRLKHQIKASQDELSLQTQQHDQSETTPPSKRQLVEIERKKEMALRLMSVQRARIQTQQRVAEQSEEERKLAESIAQDPTNLSGSSQSQDSIDAGQLRNGRRDSQLSIASNEHSEPSPGDLAQTLDEEIKSIDTSQGQPPLFTQFGASTDNSNRPATLSKPPVFRPVLESMTTRLEGSQESKSQQGEGFDEETKGN